MTPRRILLVVSDLMFSTRIETAAKALGLEVAAAPFARAIETQRATPADLAIVDLHGEGDPVDLVQALAAESPRPRIVAFCRHTASDLIVAARSAGADQVLPRSVFFPRLAEVLETGGVYEAP